MSEENETVANDQSSNSADSDAPVERLPWVVQREIHTDDRHFAVGEEITEVDLALDVLASLFATGAVALPHVPAPVELVAEDAPLVKLALAENAAVIAEQAKTDLPDSTDADRDAALQEALRNL